MQQDDEIMGGGGSGSSPGPDPEEGQAAAKPVGIVDDDEAMCDSLTILLEANGFEVIAFASGTEFLADERRRAIGFLVIDQHMPMTSGLAVITALRQEKLSLPAVLITGRLDPGITERAGGLDVPVLEKPFAAARLIGLIRGGLAHTE